MAQWLPPPKYAPGRDNLKQAGVPKLLKERAAVKTVSKDV